MALLNNIPIFVQTEDKDDSVEGTEHPVEKGISLTDTVVVNPVTLSLSGSIVGVGNDSAETIIEKINKLKNAGSLITYKGRNTLKNMQIRSFRTSYSNGLWDGCNFSMELTEVDVATSPYKKADAKTEKTATPTKSDIKVGSIVVFTGGNVYASSDAKQATSKRSRSTCKVTQINTASWSIHDYHLVSTDKKQVYGWCDIANITVSGSSQPSTSKTTNGGDQQTQTKTQKSATTYSGNNPWLPATFSLSEQQKIQATNPALAEQLKAAAGVVKTYSGSNPWLPATFSISEQMRIQASDPELAKQLKAAEGVV